MTNPTTPETPTPALTTPKMSPAEFKAKLFAAYKVENLEQLKKTPAWSFAVQRLMKAMKPGQSPDDGAVIRTLATVTEGINVPGWYIGPGYKLVKGQDGKMNRQPRGPIVCMSDGEIVTVDGPQLDGADPITTEIVVKDIQRTTDLFTGKTTDNIVAGKTSVVIHKHGYDMPSPTLERAIQRALKTDTETKRNKDKARGVINGDMEGAFAILTISEDENDIAYFKGKPGEKRFGKDQVDMVQIIARDANGVPVQAKIKDENLDYLRAAFYLSELSEPGDYKAALKGQPIAVRGKLGLLHPKDISIFGDAQNEAVALLQTLHGAGRFRDVKKGDSGAPLRGLVLKDYFVANAETGEPEEATFLTIGGKNVYDIQEAESDGKVKWQFSMLASDLSKPFWIDTLEHPRKDGSGVTNEGAFILFLNKLQSVGKISEDDEFAAFAKEITG